MKKNKVLETSKSVESGVAAEPSSMEDGVAFGALLGSRLDEGYHQEVGTDKALDILSDTTKFKRNLNAIVLITIRQAILDGNGNPIAKLENLDPEDTITLPMLTSNDTLSADEGEYSIKDMPQFADNLPMANCLQTGCFIENDLNKLIVATSAHLDLVADEVVDQVVMVRGWYKLEDGSFRPLTAKNLYKIRKSHLRALALDEEVEYKRQDWQFFDVEPVVRGSKDKSRAEALFSTKGRIKNGREVYCLGHGFGRPVMLSWNGLSFLVQKYFRSFRCKLVTYPGNSGSPVFDAERHELVGILNAQDGAFPIPDPPESLNFIAYRVPLHSTNGAICSHAALLKKQLKRFVQHSQITH